MSKESTIQELVERSRLGDQVATATIAVIAERAKKGERKAESIRQSILKWADSHPIHTTDRMSMFGIERPVKEDSTATARELRHRLHLGEHEGKGLALLILSLGEYALGILYWGPWLVGPESGEQAIVRELRGAWGSADCQRAFDIGNRMTNRPDALESVLSRMTDSQKKACHVGILVGKARRLQAVAKPGVPLAILSHDIAWELGE